MKPPHALVKHNAKPTQSESAQPSVHLEATYIPNKTPTATIPKKQERA